MSLTTENEMLEEETEISNGFTLEEVFDDVHGTFNAIDL